MAAGLPAHGVAFPDKAAKKRADPSGTLDDFLQHPVERPNKNGFVLDRHQLEKENINTVSIVIHFIS
jgi:hypothetical protein